MTALHILSKNEQICPGNEEPMVSHWGYEIPALFLYRPTNTFCPARTNTVDRRAAPTYSRLE